jgi:hypothetical protein
MGIPFSVLVLAAAMVPTLVVAAPIASTHQVTHAEARAEAGESTTENAPRYAARHLVAFLRSLRARDADDFLSESVVVASCCQS